MCNAMKLSLRQKKGFTLVEILIAVAILAALAAGMWEASAYIKNRSLKNQAESQIHLLEASMNAYKADTGGYLPEGKGDIYSAHILYKTLNRDENNDGEPDDVNGELQMPYCESLYVMKNTKEAETQEGIPVVKTKMKANIGGRRVSGKYFAIIDPWGQPYRYRLGFEGETEKGTVGSGMNPDFDIFSQGPDALGDGRTNENENEDNVSNVRSWK